MTDARLRELERRWQETHSEEDERRLLRARLRSGETLDDLRRLHELDPEDRDLDDRLRERLFDEVEEGLPRPFGEGAPPPCTFEGFLIDSIEFLNADIHRCVAWHRPTRRRCHLLLLTRRVTTQLDCGPARADLRTAREVEHPHLSGVVEWIVAHGHAHLALDIDDCPRTLEDLVLPRADVLPLVEKVARAVSSGHALGLTHGEIQRGTIRLTPAGEPRLASFCKHVWFCLPGRVPPPDGAIPGSLEPVLHMAPEQIMGKRMGPPSDVYQLGTLLYELLSGRAPYQRENVTKSIIAIVKEQAEPLGAIRPDLAGDPERVVAHAMAREPEDRYPDAAALLEDLARLQAGQPVLAPPLPPPEEPPPPEPEPAPRRSWLSSILPWRRDP